MFPTTFPPRKILAAVDDTAMAEAVWARTEDWAGRFRAEAHALYVRQWIYAVGGYDFSPAEAALTLERVSLEDLRRRLPGAPLRVAEGLPALEIPRWAAEEGYDLLVMGTHGRHGFERLVMGSVAEAVIGVSQVPVLIVRSGMTNIRSVLCPVNGQPYAAQALLLAAKAAAALKRHLRVLNVVEQPHFGPRCTLAQGKALAARAVLDLPPELRERCRPEVEFAAGEAAAEISQRADERDLVVLAAHSRGFLKDRVLGTTAQKVLRFSPASVLALPVSPSPAHRPLVRVPAWLQLRPRTRRSGLGA